MVNSFGPGNQENPKRAANGVGAYNGKKKKPTNTFNTPTGGTPAANPMGGAQMDFDMPDMSGMGGMPMSAPSPTGGGNYENFMMGMMSPATQHGEQFGTAPPAYSDPSGSNWGGIDDSVGMGLAPSYSVAPSDGTGTTAGGLSGLKSGDMLEPGDRRPHPWYGQTEDWWFPRDGEVGELPPWSGDPVIYGMAGDQSPQVSSWDDPAMGAFQMDDPTMSGMQMGQPDMGAFQMEEPMTGYGPDMSEDIYGELPGMSPDFQKGLVKEVRSPYAEGSSVGGGIDDPLSSQANFAAAPAVPPAAPAVSPVAPVVPPVAPVVDSLPAVSQVAPPVSEDPVISRPPVSEVAPVVSEAPVVEPAVAPAVFRPPTGQPDWKGDDTPEPVLRDDRFISKSDTERPATPADDAGAETELEPGRNYGTDPDPRAVGPPMVTSKDKPALEEFKDKVDAGEVSDEEPALKPWEQPFVSSKDKPAAPAGPVSEGAMMDERNWDTVDGEYKFMGADYHKRNTRPETDTKDWKKTRKEAAEDIKEGGDNFSEVGDAAYGTASSKSRSAANEAAEPVQPTAPLVKLPPTQPPPVEKPSADAEYYNKMVNPDPFQNPTLIDLPAGYGHQRVEDGDEFHKYQGRKYDVDPKEILTEEGEPVMPSQGIDSDAGGMSVLDTRMHSVSPAKTQALVNNAVAQNWGKFNQGLGGTTSARPGMSSDMGSYAQQVIAPLVAAKMASGQAQIDIPWQYAMQHADQVRQRRDLAHKLGLAEAGMITDDYYDYLGDKMATADIDNLIMRQLYGEMPDAFG